MFIDHQKPQAKRLIYLITLKCKTLLRNENTKLKDKLGEIYRIHLTKRQFPYYTKSSPNCSHQQSKKKMSKGNKYARSTFHSPTHKDESFKVPSGTEGVRNENSQALLLGVGVCFLWEGV